MAGDFYGTKDSISDGQPGDRPKLFMAAYNTLRNNADDQPRDAERIIETLQDEVTGVKNCITNKRPPSEYYKDGGGLQGVIRMDLNLGTRKNIPKYSSLLRINFDHFGEDARKAYAAGHTAAIEYAVADGQEKTLSRLIEAYYMNAFADHFLQDLFSAGHMRTPRRALHGSYAGIPGGKDAFANVWASQAQYHLSIEAIITLLM